MRALTEEFGILLIFDEVKTGLPARQGRRRRVLRHQAGPRDVRQGDGQRLPGGRVRRPRARSWSMLPDKVSHGGTYAGNRVAAAAAVKTLEILRDTNALETIHATGRRIQDGLTRDPQPDRAAVPLHRPSVDVRDHVHATSSPTEYRDWANDRPRAVRRDRRSACTPAARCRSRTRREPWFMCEAHAEGDIVDRVLTAFEDSLDAALEARAHGEPRRTHGAHATPQPADVNEDGGMVARRQRGPLGRSGGGPAARARRQPGRGRRHRARPAARSPQVDGVAPARHAPEARAGRAGRRDRQVPARPRRHPAGRTRRADARPARHRDARARAPRAPDPRDDRSRHPRRRPRSSRSPRPMGRTSSPSATGPAGATRSTASPRARCSWPRSPSARSCASSAAGSTSYTDRTIVDLEPLLEELARIRRRGYATAIGEYELGLNAVSAAGPRRARRSHRRGRRLGPGVPAHAAAHPGARARRCARRPPPFAAPGRAAEPGRGPCPARAHGRRRRLSHRAGGSSWTTAAAPLPGARLPRDARRRPPARGTTSRMPSAAPSCTS